MNFIKTEIPDLILIEPKVFADERGFFMESYKKSLFHANGIIEEFVQDNHSKSMKGVLRGLHYQLNPKAQGKLVRCVAGSVFDVSVDIRKNSPTFGKWAGFELSAENKKILWIPAGFAHGFLTLQDDTEFLYKTSNEYSDEHDRGIKFDDPTIGIKWTEIGMDYILSEKDKKASSLNEIEVF